MKVLLDTDTCVHLIRYRDAGVLRRIRRYSPGDVGISSITLAELAFGASKSARPDENRVALEQFTAALEIAAFDEMAALHYGNIRAQLQSAGKAIGSLDMLIGAHALSLQVTLITHNTREFSRISGLRLADWIE